MKNKKSNPVNEMMQGSYFYESTHVKKSRKSKMCNLCGQTIPAGTSSNGAKLFNDEFYQVDFCNPCEVKYKSDLDLMKSGSLDSY